MKEKNNCSNYSDRALRVSLRKCIVPALSLIIIIKTVNDPAAPCDSGGSAKSKLPVKAEFFSHIRELSEREKERERESERMPMPQLK